MVFHFTADQFLQLGLELMGLTVGNVLRSNRNLERFLAIFGTPPEAMVSLWSDLQTTHIVAARVDHIDFKYFMMTFNWLKSYKLLPEMVASFQVCEDTVRTWVWFYVKKIQALKEVKIRWDVIANSPDAIPVSDGGQCGS